MKKYIREMLDDIRKQYDPAASAPVPEDLNNQELSSDPDQRVRQLDFQAQEAEERERLE